MQRYRDDRILVEATVNDAQFQQLFNTDFCDSPLSFHTKQDALATNIIESVIERPNDVGYFTYLFIKQACMHMYNASYVRVCGNNASNNRRHVCRRHLLGAVDTYEKCFFFSFLLSPLHQSTNSRCYCAFLLRNIPSISHIQKPSSG